MKKSQFASLHAGMLVRGSAAPAQRAKRNVEVSAAEPVAATAAGQTATAEAQVWRSDGPTAFESWEHLRAELLPPGWGRSSAASTDTAVTVEDEQRSALPKPALVARNDGDAEHDDGEHPQQRQHGGFGRRATPPPAHDDGHDADFEAEAHDADADIAPKIETAAPIQEAEAVDDADDYDELTVEEPTAASADTADAELDIPEPADMAAQAFTDLDVPSAALDYEDIRDEVLADAAMAAIGDADDELDDVEFAEVEQITPAAVDCDGDGEVIEAPDMAAGRRKAMTVRLDLPRHRRLRLAGVYYGRSCQDLMVTALDGYLAQLGFGADTET